jgi:hypothetical protein
LAWPVQRVAPLQDDAFDAVFLARAEEVGRHGSRPARQGGDRRGQLEWVDDDE